MTKTSLIAAIDEQRGLGKNNQLLWHLPADLKHFKELTMNKPIIMGRKTYESIGRPLPDRLNVVLSKQNLDIPGVTVVHSLNEAMDVTAEFPERMIIGGALIYKQALPLAQTVYLTVVHAHFDADVFFPNLDDAIWCLSVSRFREADEHNPHAMSFYCYERRAAKSI